MPVMSEQITGDRVNDSISRQASYPHRLFRLNAPSSIATLKKLCSQNVDVTAYPQCMEAPKNIPVYDLSLYNASNEEEVSNLQDEWHAVLHTGPGVLVLKNIYPKGSLNVIKQSNKAFDAIIENEEASGNKRGDHFAASSSNSRIWNSLQKHALIDSASFLQYYSNPWLKHVSEAWLGPDYTITAQVNIVRPGGKPQMPHRDYHLGFQTAEQSARWPKTMHSVSQFLTLQGAVAHSDMPLESGPTRFLPFSQNLEDGFMAWRSQEVKDFFADRWVSLPLDKGDAVFFNPALIHAAGENLTEKGTGIDRSANLLQISSAFGKTMEKIDHEQIVTVCWDDLMRCKFSDLEAESVIRAMTDGYPFPTNLDQRPPAPGGMAPGSQTDIVLDAWRKRKTKEDTTELLKQYRLDSSA